MTMNLSSLSSSVDETWSDDDYRLFKSQLEKAQNMMEDYNSKMVDKTLCYEDLVHMNNEMENLTELEQRTTLEKLKSNYVPFKAKYLKLVQESYRVCNWLMEKQFNEVDNVFDIESFTKNIFDACKNKENPLDHMNSLFEGVFKETDYFDLNFYGNIQSSDINISNVLTQCKKECKKTQKRQLEELVVPDEAENVVGDNEMQMALKRVHRCLKKAVSNNEGKPISFYKFAFDPFSLTYTVENLFNIASLYKDGVVKIKRTSDDTEDVFTTITVAKKNDNDDNKGNIEASFFTINNELWKSYLEKYNITERMIEQDE